VTAAAAYGFALLAAVLWGASAVIAKRGLASGGSSILVALLGTVLGTVIFWSALAVSTGAAVVGRLTPTAAATFAAAGLVGSAGGRLLYYVGLRRVGATIGDAVTGSNPLFATLLALVVIGEPIRPVEFAGMLVVVAGIVVLSVSKGGDISGWEPRELAFPLVASVAFGAGTTLRRHGFVLTDATPVEATALNSTAAAVGIAGFVLATGRTGVIRAPRRAYAYFGVAALFVPLGLLSLMAALELGRVVVVAPIAGTVPVFTAAFGAAFLGDLERITRGTVVGIACIVAGVALLTGG